MVLSRNVNEPLVVCICQVQTSLKISEIPLDPDQRRDPRAPTRHAILRLHPSCQPSSRRLVRVLTTHLRYLTPKELSQLTPLQNEERRKLILINTLDTVPFSVLLYCIVQ